MTDLASLVAYDEAVPVEIMLQGKAVGVTIWVKHIDCDAATKAGRDHDEGKYPDHSRGAVVIAACIDRWDWGEQTFEGSVPELTMATALEVVSKVKWMVSDLVKAARDLGNFTAD